MHRAGRRPAVHEPPLAGAERSELLRQGAKAAARGEPNDTNPLSLSRNQPPATGESAGRWLQRSDAWAQGHEAQSLARRRGVGHLRLRGSDGEQD